MATGPTSGPGSAAYYRSRMRAIMREDARRATTTMDGGAPYGRATRSGKPKPPPSRTAKSRGQRPSGKKGTGVGPKKVAPPRRTAGGTYR